MEEIKQFGRYEIIKMVGKGAMGYVFKAYDPKLDRIVALKTLQWDSKISELKKDHYYKRFLQEAKITGKLNHPGIVKFFDFGEENDIPFITMEFIDGVTLEKRIKNRDLTQEDIKNITVKVLEALSYAHKNGVVHRDLKPGNIMISDNEIKITDFGIAHVDDSDLTKTGNIVGSPNYMSPEQVRGKKIDNRSDLFSLGITLYYMLTNIKPFAGKNIPETIHNIIDLTPQSPSLLNDEVSAQWDYIVEKLLEKDRDVRYQTCEEVLKDIYEMDDVKVDNPVVEENRILDNSITIDNMFTEATFDNTEEESVLDFNFDRRFVIVFVLIVINLILIYLLWRV